MENLVKCPACGGAKIVKNGFRPSGKQNYKCRGCGRQFVENPTETQISALVWRFVFAALNERVSLRAVARIFGVSLSRVAWADEASGRLARPWVPPPPADASSPWALEADEMWTFVGSKKEPFWLWLLLDRATGAVVAFHLGNRSEAACRALWAKVPDEWKRNALVYTDLWRAYRAVLPTESHCPCDERGPTNRVERLNGTLRAKCSRLVRRSYSFSKRPDRLEGSIKRHIQNHNELCKLRASSFA